MEELKKQELSKFNQNNFFSDIQNSFEYIKIDKITDYINKNYSVRLYGLPFNVIIFHLKKYLQNENFKKTNCVLTYSRNYNENVYIRIDYKNKFIYLDFYSY